MNSSSVFSSQVLTKTASSKEIKDKYLIQPMPRGLARDFKEGCYHKWPPSYTYYICEEKEHLLKMYRAMWHYTVHDKLC